MTKQGEIARENMSVSKEISNEIPADIIAEAKELCRGAEVLPEGYLGLARRINELRKEGKSLRAKLGVDPTATDLHIGHAVVFRKLRRFQDFGHQVVLIIGGFTAQIGDPSGRNATRPPLTAEQVKENAQSYLEQMGLILDLSKVEVVNNADWLSPLSMREILALAGKVTVNQLLAKEGFGTRIENQQPVALHELFYPLLQAYDSVAIKADIELGGTDQRFNILQGRELQPHYGLAPQLAMFLPLLEGTDGVKKMSKSYDNYIALREAPSDMYGKSMRIPDELIIKYFELTTTLTGAEIDEIKNKLDGGGNPKDAKEKLAAQLVRQYHGEDAAQAESERWKKIHGERQIPDEMPSHVVADTAPLFRVMADSGLAGGTGEAKRLCQEGAVRLDGEQMKDPNHSITLAGEQTMVLQVGRRKFVRLTKGG